MLELVGEAGTEAFAARLAPLCRAGDAIALSGELGAGKTAFARGLLRGLGHTGEVPSPTYTLVQHYEPPDVRLPVWHADLYRLQEAAEADAIGLGEALDVLLIAEWPEHAPGLFRDALWLTFEGAGEPARRLTARVPDAWEDRWPPR